MSQPSRDLKFVAAGGRLIAITGTAAADTGLRAARLYRISVVSTPTANAADAGVAFRWGANDPTIADGGFDFVILTGESLIIRAQATELRGIRVSAVDSTVMIQAIDEGV